MWRVLFTFLALALGSATVGCEVKRCTLMGCAYTVDVTVIDEQGGPIERFSGTAVVEGITYSFECSDDPSESRVSGGQGDGFAMCYAGHLTLPFPSGTQPSIVFTISSDDGASFQGDVVPSYTVNGNFNGKGCGTCTYGEVTVTLQ